MSDGHVIGSIIDFKVVGNTVRFFLGRKDFECGWINKDFIDENGKRPFWLKHNDDYYGDDWDDVPYECNAGKVYDEFIIGIRDYYFDVDWIIVEPCSGEFNSVYCKNDFKKREIPCLIVIKNNLALKHEIEDSFQYWHDFLINNGNGEEYDAQDIEAFYFEDLLMSGITIETDKFSLTF